MGNLLQDLRYGLRNLARDRGFVIVAMLTLALGIGANTTIFSVMNGTLLKPIPFPGADRLTIVWETFGKGSDNWNIVSAPNFWDFQKRARSFESMAIFDSAGRGYNLSPSSNAQEAEQVSGLRVSAGFFQVLGAKPLLGRTFLPEEETLGKDREVVLTYGLWKTRYNGDASLVGRTIRIDGAEFTQMCIRDRFEHEQHVMIEAALEKLSPIFREAVVLRDITDMSYEEIAEVLGVSLGTVKSRILRGREALRAELVGSLKHGPAPRLVPKTAE